MKTIVAAVVALISCAAMAHDGMAVKDAYARASNPKAGAAFMVLENHRKVDCVLTSASTEAAEKAELHTHKEVDGVMKMTRIDQITVPAEGDHALQRGGDHVMLMGLKAPLEDGQSISLTLDFGDCGTETIEVPVDNQRTPEQGAMTGMGQDAEHKGH